MTDKILAVLSFILLAGFMGIVAVFVNVPNLWGVILLVLGLAFYDLWSTIRDTGANGAGNGDRRT